MSGFSGFLSLSPSGDGRWRLTAPMAFDLVHGDPATRIVVPEGFVSDGASIPVMLRLFFDRGDSRYMRAAILHDFMLMQSISPNVPLYTIRQCSDAFADALRAAKVSEWRVRLMRAAVFAWTSIF